MIPSPVDLFGEVPVTWSDLYEWCDRQRVSLTPWRREWYIKNWNVADKVRRAKLAGTFYAEYSPFGFT